MRKPSWNRRAGLLGSATGCMDFEGLEGDRSIHTNVDDWRDEIIYQLMTDRFANGDLANDYRVQQGGAGALSRRRLARRRGASSTTFRNLGVTALWISPSSRTSRPTRASTATTATGRRTSPSSTRTSATRRAPPHGRRGPLSRHQGDPRHRREPRGPALLLRHQLERAARRARGGLGDGHLARAVRLHQRAAEAVSDQPRRSRQRVRPGLRPARRAGVDQPRRAGPGAHRVRLRSGDRTTCRPSPPIFQEARAYNRRGRVWDWNADEQVEFGDFPGASRT